jgi:hypothetical protein
LACSSKRLKWTLASQDEFRVKLTYVHQREEVAQWDELTAGHYISASAQSYRQIQHMLCQLDTSTLIIFLINYGGINKYINLNNY